MRKICRNCKCNKDISEFYKASNNTDGYRNACKTCMNLASKKYEANGYSDKRKVDYRNNITATKEKQRIYRNNNRSKLASKMVMYRKTPNGKLVAKNGNNKRRAKETAGSVTTEQLQVLLQTNACFYCNITLADTLTHIDHFIPLSKGGLHDIHNLVVTCAKCNLSKRALMPEVFYRQIGKNPTLVYEEDFLDW